MENIIYVTSASNHTLVVAIPELQLHRTWTKKGQKFPFDRKTLMQIYYNPGVEYLFKCGLLVTDDIDFLKEVGLADENGSTELIVLTDALLKRMIHLMPVSEFKEIVSKLSHDQIKELEDYAILHFSDLSMDRVDILSKITGKDILKSIELYKSSLEG